ncbi:xylose isomerase family protein [Actinidia rufa]|uniref:Xylose isomerase n=1 Tax=Actinidia rufa TaxID=165716 RepID=A0A7J0G6R6_9ERIC|nr:xylose isomerase family protein [Actinidia rufa]
MAVAIFRLKVEPAISLWGESQPQVELRFYLARDVLVDNKGIPWSGGGRRKYGASVLGWQDRETGTGEKNFISFCMVCKDLGSNRICHHELETARINGLLGNIDANTGDPQIGWDTDQFMTDIAEATLVMQSVVRNGGIAPGGFNFDAKLRRESTDVEDLFIAHVGGMDTMARGLRNVAKLIEDGSLAELVLNRYQSFDSELGALVEAGKADFDLLEKKAMEWGELQVPSAKQELAEMIFQSVL